MLFHNRKHLPTAPACSMNHPGVSVHLLRRELRHQPVQWRWAMVWIIAFTIVLAKHAAAEDQPFHLGATYLPRNCQKDGHYVHRAFTEVTRLVAPSTVTLSLDGETVALGLVVASDGYVVTKASQISHGQPVVHLQSGIQRRATVVETDTANDLALLKIAAGDLTTPTWSDGPEPAVGRWVVTVAPSPDPVVVGVVSVGSRKITARSMLGVRLQDTEDGVVVQRVLPHSGAAEAGILEDDIIMEIDGRATPTWQKLIRQIRDLPPGVEIEVTILRGGDRRTLKATLGVFDSSPEGRASRLNRLGGEISRRSAGFPSAFQHDTVLAPTDCGGPIVDLSGRIVGLNIARAGRTDSYAIPTDELRPVLDRMLLQARRDRLDTPTEQHAEPVAAGAD